MGPSPTRQLIPPEQDNFSSRFTYIRNQGDINFYIENASTKEYGSKIIICDSPQQQTQFFAFAEKTTHLRHQNIIAIQKVYCLENRSCGTVASKYMILFPYPFRSIRDQRDQRLVLQQNFTEPELWSIMLSVCRTLDYLHSQSIPFTPLASQQILIDKQGLIQLDVHRLVENSLLQDNYVSRNKNLRYAAPECKRNRVNYFNLRDVEKYNIYSLGIIVLQCLEMRDIAELDEDRGGQKQILQLLINRSTYVSGELRQIIRRLTEQRKQNRPTYRQIIDFIENEEGTSGVLYHQNEIPTAKKNSHIDHNSLNFEGFYGRPSSNARINIPRSSTIANGYAIPSFSYNNIKEGIQGSKQKDMMGETQIPPRSNHRSREINKMSYQNDMIENSTGLPPPSPQKMRPLNFHQVHHQQVITIPSVPVTGSIVHHSQNRMMETGGFSPMTEAVSYIPQNMNSLNFPKQVSPARMNIIRPQISQSPSVIKQIQSNVSQIDSNLKLNRAHGVADDIKLISPKPSFFARDSNYNNINHHQTRHNFSKTGSIEGYNKIYNDKPENYYDKIDFKDLNNIGPLWLFFEGNFKDGKRFGPGTLYMSNGEKFTGNFINDLAEGRGKYSTLDWKEVEGIWKNGNLMTVL